MSDVKGQERVKGRRKVWKSEAKSADGGAADAWLAWLEDLEDLEDRVIG